MGAVLNWLRDVRTAIALGLGAAVGVLWHLWRRARFQREISQINRERAEIQLKHSRALVEIGGAESSQKALEADRHRLALVDLEGQAAEVSEAASESRAALAAKMNELFK